MSKPEFDKTIPVNPPTVNIPSNSSSQIASNVSLPPKIPSIPTVPAIPKIPAIPNIPAIPKIPAISSIPTVVPIVKIQKEEVKNSSRGYF